MDKTLRLCLECRDGVIVADNTIYNKQEVYCVSCGTKHHFRKFKNGCVRLQKYSEKCDEKTRVKLLRESKIIMAELVQEVKLYIKESKEQS